MKTLIRESLCPHSPAKLLAIEPLECDSESVESCRQVQQTQLLLEITRHCAGLKKVSFGGSQFIYSTKVQAGSRLFRWTVFFVKGAGRARTRSWGLIWKSGGRCAGALIELLSLRIVRKCCAANHYPSTFKTFEHSCCDSEAERLDDRRRGRRRFPITADPHACRERKKVRVFLDRQSGEHLNYDAIWLRNFGGQGDLIPTSVDTEPRNAGAEVRRGDADSHPPGPAI